jgi:hypothetical protein
MAIPRDGLLFFCLLFLHQRWRSGSRTVRFAYCWCASSSIVFEWPAGMAAPYGLFIIAVSKMKLLDRVASSLKAAGFPILKVSECTKLSDGGVWINSDICVVVATNGEYVCVTTQSEPGVFDDLDDRDPRDLEGVIADVRSVFNCN